MARRIVILAKVLRCWDGPVTTWDIQILIHRSFYPIHHGTYPAKWLACISYVDDSPWYFGNRVAHASGQQEHRKSIYVSTGSSSEIPLMPQVDHDSCKESTRTSRISLCADSNRKWQRDVIMAARYHWCLKYVMTSCKRSTRTPEIDIRFYMKWHRDIIGIPYIMTGTRWVCLQAWLRVLDARLLQ